MRPPVRRLCCLAFLTTLFVFLCGVVYLYKNAALGGNLAVSILGGKKSYINNLIEVYNHQREIETGPSKKLSETIDIRHKKLLLFNASCRHRLTNGTYMDKANIVINKNQLKKLQTIIKQKCYDDKAVPNVVHYVWLGPKKREMKFYQFLSVYSCHKYLHPCLILFHGETLPYGRYWDLLQTVVPNIVHVNRTSPTHIEGIKIKHIEHKADMVRFHALRDFGGIYMDTDSVALKPMDTLRSHDFTLGINNPGVLGIATILSVPNAEFLDIWLKYYLTFDADEWGLHSVILPYRLSKKYPHLIHVEKNYTFYHGGSGDKLVNRVMNWEHMYAMHLSMRYYGSIPFNETTIRHMKSTLGEMGRHILFDDKGICSV